jgi:hypothetical protein
LCCLVIHESKQSKQRKQSGAPQDTETIKVNGIKKSMINHKTNANATSSDESCTTLSINHSLFYHYQRVSLDPLRGRPINKIPHDSHPNDTNNNVSGQSM